MLLIISGVCVSTHILSIWHIWTHVSHVSCLETSTQIFFSNPGWFFALACFHSYETRCKPLIPSCRTLTSLGKMKRFEWVRSAKQNLWHRLRGIVRCPDTVSVYQVHANFVFKPMIQGFCRVSCWHVRYIPEREQCHWLFPPAWHLPVRTHSFKQNRRQNF